MRLKSYGENFGTTSMSEAASFEQKWQNLGSLQVMTCELPRQEINHMIWPTFLHKSPQAELSGGSKGNFLAKLEIGKVLTSPTIYYYWKNVQNFKPIFEQNADGSFEPIFEQNQNFESIS